MSILSGEDQYCALGPMLTALSPTTEATYWLASAALWLTGIVLVYKSPPRIEASHRSPLPVYLKLPITLVLVAGLVSIKGLLAVFATLFPLVSVLAAYEARHSLGTVGGQVPVLIITMVPMMATIRLVQPMLGVGPTFAAGWFVFLCLYAPLSWSILFRCQERDKVLLRSPEPQRQ